MLLADSEGSLLKQVKKSNKAAADDWCSSPSPRPRAAGPLIFGSMEGF